MIEHNFYSDIKESIACHFAFLKELGFSDFEEKQLAYELHFEAKNTFVLLDIYFEANASTPIWVTIDGYYIENLELDNQKVKDYKSKLKENYDYLFQQYLDTNKRGGVVKISEQYAVNGKEINDNYLNELSDVLKRHIGVLNGDLELLKSNTQIVKKAYELEKSNERIRKGIFTLEYQLFSKEGYDCFEEFNSIYEIERYLDERAKLKNTECLIAI